MNIPRESHGEVNADLGDVHRFGQASESLFRRLYRGLSRRRQLEFELQRQRQISQRQIAESATLRRRVEALETEGRQRGGELERLTQVLSSLEDGIVVQDINGKVTMMNQAAQEMLGGKRAFWDSALGAMFEQYRDVGDTAAELTPLGESAELPLNNRFVRAQLIAIGDEGKRRIGTVIILRDVTHDALAERLKNGFVTHIARDMERPVGVIKLAGELLSAQPEDADINQRLLDKLLRNVDVLDQLALELVDISQLSAGVYDVRREPVIVESAIWSVVNGIDAEVKSRGIDLLVMTRGLSGVQIRGDDSRLQWALGHLIRNGASYNSDGGYVAVAARAELRDAKTYALISVSDNGVGISGEDLPHIFERFYRGGASAADARPPGLGQGLYVARAICQAHGGFLDVQSRLNVGSIFTMGLPVYAAAVA
ncbi:MAG: ATP-binding protein [Chloroflexota bacterium]|nr:ATP-binding protein [Chloroflexota bacterium]MDE2948560.1 ATP-binding protein [Chloroflexota bacterium]